MRLSSRLLQRAAVPAVALALAAQLAIACDTPVYRYAMYRWEPAPYEVYFFHDQPAAEPDQQIGRLAESMSNDPERPANVLYFDVNLADDPEMTRISPRAKAAFLAHEDRQLPSYLVSTPFGVEIFFGKLDEPAFRALVESPVRSEVATQLAAGKVGVFIFISSSDAAASAKAEAVLSSLVQDVGAGKVPLYISPSLAISSTGGPPQPPAAELGLVKVARDDPQEQWLIRSLFAMEAELKAEDVPMTFLVYGRGRALLPYLGEGITHENLLYEIEFITGACSCTVKEQNPGADLLVRQNWQEAAMKLAEKFSGEEGSGAGMFFPELVIPSGSAPEAALAASTGDDNVVAAGGEAAAIPVAAASGDAAPEPAASSPTAVTADSSTSPATQAFPADQPPTAPAPVDQPLADQPPAPEKDAVAAVEPAAGTAAADATQRVATESGRASELSAASSYWSIFAVGGAVLVSLVVLFALTFAVLRPR